MIEKKKYIYVPNAPEMRHLHSVMKEMRIFGRPTLFCVLHKEAEILPEHYYTLDGSHRVSACYLLGLIPRLILVPKDYYIVASMGQTKYCIPKKEVQNYKEHYAGINDAFIVPIKERLEVLDYDYQVYFEKIEVIKLEELI